MPEISESVSPRNGATSEPFIALAVDGGGIRGLYSASVLDALVRRFAAKRDAASLDVGKGFDLIAGTSTGGILACGLAHGCSPLRLAKLYSDAGPKIFNGAKIPEGWRFALWAWKHRARPIHQNQPLRESLTEIFGSETLGSIYQRRGIALCLPSVRLLNETARIFKTGHLSANHRKDDELKIVEVCLATAAAPVFLPLTTVRETPHGPGDVFADGGLWMNNPTIVALLEALALTPIEREIIVLSVGTCPATAGGNPAAINLNRGLAGWRAGAKALELSMNVQAQASVEMLNRLTKELVRLGRKISIVRLHESKPSAEQSRHLTLDNASPEALGLLRSFGDHDATESFRWVQQGDTRGAAITRAFERMPTKRTDD